jgi:1-acyl-sn-glycerol-3-phosphate acyltransferase
MPMLANVAPLAKALGVPCVPITANMLALGPLLGPLGAFLHFPAKFKLRVLDPVHFDVPPDQPRYSRSKIMDESEDIRQQIQEALYDMLRQRRSVWTG